VKSYIELKYACMVLEMDPDDFYGGKVEALSLRKGEKN